MRETADAVFLAAHNKQLIIIFRRFERDAKLLPRQIWSPSNEDFFFPISLFNVLQQLIFTL